MKDTWEIDGFTIQARLKYDDDAQAPWDREDGHGPVSEWTTREKAPGERVLCADRSSKRYYDFAEAVRIAKRDGWDAPPYGTGTAGERAARAAEADYQRLRDWCEDRWHYVGVVLSVSRNGVMLDNHAASLWGIEDDAGDYLTECAEDMLDEAVRVGHAVLAKIAA